MKPRKTFLSQPHLTFETPIQTGCQAQVKTVKVSLAGNQLCKYQSYQDSDACHPETSITS